MKRVLLIAVYLLTYAVSHAQEQENIIAALEQHAEITSENEGVEKEDDSFVLLLENYKRHPLHLNKTGAGDLRQLMLLNEVQIESFLSYRKLFGDLLNIYELQAVPFWNVELIRQLLPFITIAETTTLVEHLGERWKSGTHNVLIRSATILERSEGYNKPQGGESYYTGSPYRLTTRYTYNYRNLLQWGLSGDKDAGEEFFKGTRKSGFDFYSFHFFLSKLGIIKSLAMGDFTVNMGQGLIQWQSLAFSKSAEISFVKRQSEILHPHTAVSESGFHRGGGITFQKRRWETTVFFSTLKLSGNLVRDSVDDAGHISSINSSGYHRTVSELQDRYNLNLLTAGASVKFSTPNAHLAFNTVQYQFSLPLQKTDQPYNLFAATGTKFSNKSVDFSYTFKNFHLFGEVAVDRNWRPALVTGILACLSPSLDLSLLYRSIDKSYRSFGANAFTENSAPVNEHGLYTAITFRPGEHLKVNFYADYFYFPWLKYRVDAPSSGREYYFKLTYIPGRKVELYTHIKFESKQQNVLDASAVSSVLSDITKQNWRIHADITINSILKLRTRVEWLLFNKNKFNSEEGYLIFVDLLCKPPVARWSGNMRLEYFETEGYNSRLFAFENDVSSGFSIPAIFDKGYRYYINCSYNLSASAKHLLPKDADVKLSVKLAQTLYSRKDSIGSGLDLIQGNHKTELKLQIAVSF